VQGEDSEYRADRVGGEQWFRGGKWKQASCGGLPPTLNLNVTSIRQHTALLHLALELNVLPGGDRLVCVIAGGR